MNDTNNDNISNNQLENMQSSAIDFTNRYYGKENTIFNTRMETTIYRAWLHIIIIVEVTVVVIIILFNLY